MAKILTAEESWQSVNELKIMPGSPEAKAQGCLCSGERERFRDGIGYETHDDCPLHQNLPELAE